MLPSTSRAFGTTSKAAAANSLKHGRPVVHVGRRNMVCNRTHARHNWAIISSLRFLFFFLSLSLSRSLPLSPPKKKLEFEEDGKCVCTCGVVVRCAMRGLLFPRNSAREEQAQAPRGSNAGECSRLSERRKTQRRLVPKQTTSLETGSVGKS